MVRIGWALIFHVGVGGSKNHQQKKNAMNALLGPRN